MSSTPELALLSHMLREGDFRPLTKGEITADFFLTDAGRMIHDFILGYRHISGGTARWPSLDIVQDRFEASGVELPKIRHDTDINRLLFEVRDRKARQELYELSEKLSLAAADTAKDTLGVVSAAADTLKKIQNRAGVANQFDLSYAIDEIVVDYTCGAIVTPGFDWPWPSMTQATKGIHRKEFIVIAGRPKSRKTFVALNVAMHAVSMGARVLFISPEMPARMVLLRALAFLAKVRYTEFKNASLNDAEMLRFLSICESFARVSGQSEDDYALHIHKHLGLNPGALPAFIVAEGANKPVSWIESQVEVHQPDIVVVDSFYRLSAGHGKKSDTDWKVVSHVSRALKDMAMTTGTAVIGTHQLNRDADNKVGTLSNMALADAVGQDADFIARVITGKINGGDRSAIFMLAAREVPFDGVIINNKPCWDYEEVSIIDNISQVEELMKREEEDSNKGGKSSGRDTTKKTRPNVTPNNVTFAPKPEDVEGADLDDIANQEIRG